MKAVRKKVIKEPLPEHIKRELEKLFSEIESEQRLARFERRRERARIHTHMVSNQYVILNNLIKLIRENDIQMLFIDLFAGAGGVSEGIYMAEVAGRKCALTYYAINHDLIAIQSHASNHGYAFHADEDIRTFDLTHLAFVTDILRRLFPHIKINLWASLECTNFSRAKGGKEKNADSRTLAEHLYRYVEAINPDMVWIENVSEFMAWGPLDDNNKPISSKNGIDFIRWKEHLESYGYNCEYKELNAADFGAFTSRIRLFMQFAKPGIDIVWPEATHAKAAKLAKQALTMDMFSYKPLQKWRAVKEVLDFDDVGNSIFDRDKKLSPKTHERIYQGCIKYIAGGKEAFMVNYHHSSQADSVENPNPALTKSDRHGLVQPDFLMKYYSNGGQHDSIEGPAGTMGTKDTFAFVRTNWIARDFSRPAYYSSPDEPIGSLPATPKASLMTAESFLMRYYSGNPEHRNSSLDEPAGVVRTNNTFSIVNIKPFIMDTQFNNGPRSVEDPGPVLNASRRHPYLINPQWGLQDSSVEKPCFTLIARMDKAPPYLVNAEETELPIYTLNLEKFFDKWDWQYVSDVAYGVYGPMVKKSVCVDIVEFMGMYGIIDIKMRMLKVSELKLIQGFKPAYVLLGNQTNQKKFIGNSVPPPMVKAMMESSARYFKEERKAA